MLLPSAVSVEVVFVGEKGIAVRWVDVHFGLIWTQKIKAATKKPDGGAGSAEIYQTRARGSLKQINFGRFAYAALRDGFFVEAERYIHPVGNW